MQIVRIATLDSLEILGSLPIFAANNALRLLERNVLTVRHSRDALLERSNHSHPEYVGPVRKQRLRTTPDDHNIANLNRRVDQAAEYIVVGPLDIFYSHRPLGGIGLWDGPAEIIENFREETADMLVALSGIGLALIEGISNLRDDVMIEKLPFQLLSEASGEFFATTAVLTSDGNGSYR